MKESTYEFCVPILASYNPIGPLWKKLLYVNIKLKHTNKEETKIVKKPKTQYCKTNKYYYLVIMDVNVLKKYLL